MQKGPKPFSGSQKTVTVCQKLMVGTPLPGKNGPLLVLKGPLLVETSETIFRVPKTTLPLPLVARLFLRLRGLYKTNECSSSPASVLIRLERRRVLQRGALQGHRLQHEASVAEQLRV